MTARPIVILDSQRVYQCTDDACGKVELIPAEDAQEAVKEILQPASIDESETDNESSETDESSKQNVDIGDDIVDIGDDGVVDLDALWKAIANNMSTLAGFCKERFSQSAALNVVAGVAGAVGAVAGAAVAAIFGSTDEFTQYFEVIEKVEYSVFNYKDGESVKLIETLLSQIGQYQNKPDSFQSDDTERKRQAQLERARQILSGLQTKVNAWIEEDEKKVMEAAQADFKARHIILDKIEFVKTTTRQALLT